MPLYVCIEFEFIREVLSTFTKNSVNIVLNGDDYGSLTTKFMILLVLKLFQGNLKG